MTIQTITFHKRSTGKTGQVLASPQVEAKLAKVERLYAEYHGVKLGRGKLYDIVLDASRQAKEEVGGYLQYTTQAVVGIVLEHMHRELGKAVRRKNRDTIGIEVGEFTIVNLRSLARNTKGKVYDANGKRVLKGKVA
tara:strand:+ start:1075 stop:1485 length:411 start_codon:yes stop_codon:yes gene_type:complete